MFEQKGDITAVYRKYRDLPGFLETFGLQELTLPEDMFSNAVAIPCLSILGVYTLLDQVGEEQLDLPRKALSHLRDFGVGLLELGCAGSDAAVCVVAILAFNFSLLNLALTNRPGS